MKPIAMALVAGALLTSASTVFAEERKCKCVANGAMYVEGQVVCLRIGSSRFTARCERFLNNTTWTRIQDGCDALGMSPPVDAGSTDSVEIAELD